MRNHNLARATAVSIISVLCIACGGPVGPLAGGKLSGTEHSGDEPDWVPLMADIEQIQLESNPNDPYSVNVWATGHEGELYVPTSLIMGPDDPTERTWVANVMANPDVRLRIEGTVYPRTAVRVTDETIAADVRNLLLAKHEETEDEHSDKAWIFRMDPR